MNRNFLFSNNQQPPRNSMRITGENISNISTLGAGGNGSQDSRHQFSMSQQYTSQSSMSQPDESQLESGRSQVRFQEFVSRSRHLEIMEILHDMKKRIAGLEEIVLSQNVVIRTDMTRLTKTCESASDQVIAQINVKASKNSDQAKTLFFMIEKCIKQLQDLENVCKNISKHDDCNSDANDNHKDDMPLQQYLARKSQRKIGQGAIQEASLLDDDNEFSIFSEFGRTKLAQKEDDSINSNITDSIPL